ncbi:shikimate dehydrogenase [Mesorhizobium albiziae]|uniref:Shikimate dehydrogenase (NADP(+)) n=1 Tax=Neomesorhizobium albiziae TaxID=335020 RepID=A0A1I3Y664_9HYPH|nr:shikimate dehydrogenase [Mesorhizobium albiziae]GLS30086.1 shikimate dehydrogenase (NADP(+)) [Mesorhizobium albiziae]SFK26889.1 shikimate dehydrogenase [Mesorhizobium albiziae]
MAEGGRKAFVCGHPIAHSRSPLIHNHWLRTFGIDGSYTGLDIAPADFARFASDFPSQGFVGGNVTIPHKETAFASVSRRDEAAELIGAVNTLWLEDGVTHGGNTDAYGFAANLDEQLLGWEKSRRAVVLGAGGAARAVIFALQQRGFRNIRIVNRTVERAMELSHRFRGVATGHPWKALPDLLGEADFLVNTTSLGMHGESGEVPDLGRLPDQAVVTDIVYVPLQTPLLAAAAGRGLKTIDGLGMLLHQAVPGFERWFGVRPQVSPELRTLILSDIGVTS